MPELPEVETIRRALSHHLPLVLVKRHSSPHVQSLIKSQEHNPLKQTLHEIHRKGKFLDFRFTNGTHLISHLGMSGGWQISPQKITLKHTHLQYLCNKTDGSSLYIAYIDPRRFGKLAYLRDAQSKLDQYGVDILSPQFTLDYFRTQLQRFPHKELKPLLLLQDRFSGIGNYMASEMCARAKLLPTRLIASLSARDFKNLHQATFAVVEHSLSAQGVSFRSGYRNAQGQDGEALHRLWVFWQKHCRQCQKEVSKIKQSSRATFFCSHCQS